MKKLVVIGNGMVGHRFLEELVASGTGFDITVFCAEPRAAYDRVQLTSYFSSSAEALSLVKGDFFNDHGIKLLLGEGAVKIDRDHKTVTGSQGSVVGYDVLVLATGSYPFVPPLPGKERDHCFVYRTLEDLDAIRAAAASSKSGAVIGGGLLGLEAAKALKDLGIETHVVEFAPQLMAVQVDEGGGRLLRRKIESLGVGVHTSKATQAIVDGEGSKHRMQFADGSNLDVDLIVFSAGIRPDDGLARDAGIAVGERGGVIVDSACRTSDEAIFAIGEVALWNGRIFGLVAPGYDMARVAANAIAGDGGKQFLGADMSTKLKLMGVDVGSIGDAHGRTPGAKSYTFVDEPAEIYKKIVVSEDGKLLLGAVLIGDTEDYGTLLQFALNGMTLPAQPASLILPAGSGEKVALGVDALPDSAVICSCNNVTKGDLCAAIDSGCTTPAALKETTKCSSSCGGCAALMKNVLNAELAKRGVEVNNHVCEHFAFSRQELYHIVRVNGIKSFDELITKFGKGYGCDICKPVAGSIFASCWNDHVLADKRAALQDTNDYFMANMQRDGTYSVVPRMAGGEVTPEGLIAIGQVAKKYDLYTKITGGQRVDLFGARVDQLPDIWKELVDAGFETGHAYGKSIRTVKSCVGSTWCRYGVDDSVGLAIQVENRYKGLRSPHKLKLAVSGCTRECAEAQSKDIGIIATEKGWNLYTCGNGGMKPRHADLFASDLDTATLLKYVDRILMFYIKTADRLQRTSVWMDNLEGGLDYLRDVIINDKLGIAADLEAQMQHVVDTYECEWKKTINDPEKVKRFRHFANSGEADSNLLYVRERGQRRPAYAHERAGLIPVKSV